MRLRGTWGEDLEERGTKDSGLWLALVAERMVVFTEHMKKSFERPTKYHFLNCALLDFRDAPCTPKQKGTWGNFLLTSFSIRKILNTLL